MKTYQTTLAATCCLTLLTCGAFAQGSLTPPGTPAETMKTLEQVEPRTDVTTVAGNSQYHHVISQPGSYYLSANIEVTKPSGIQINATDVTLDLNGFRISRLSGSGGMGVYILGGMDRATVRNGSMVGFGYGIYCYPTYTAKGCLFEQLAVSGCTYHGIYSRGESAVLTACRAHDNPGSGIDVGRGASLENCTASYNQGSYGIRAGSGSSLKNCSAYNNDCQFGIVVSDGATVEGCSARSNTGSQSVSYGISVGSGSLVVSCSVTSNSNTNSPGSSSHGIGIAAGSGSAVKDCSVSYNKGDGIKVSSDCTVAGNTCDSNGNSGDGAGIHVIGYDNRIDGNNVTDNDRGIDVDYSGNFIVRNTASGNTLNWEVVANNACLVVYRTGCTAISGSSGGTPPGSTDPNANYSY